MRAHCRVWNAEPNDSIYGPVAFAMPEGSMYQGGTATAAAPVWRVTGSTLTAKQLSTRLNVGRSGLDVADHRVWIMGLDQGSHVLTGTRHHIDQQRLQPNVRDLSGEIQQDDVGAPPNMWGDHHRTGRRHQPTDRQQTSTAAPHTWPAGVSDRTVTPPSRLGPARDRLPRARATASATRRAAAPQPATNRYSGPKARSEVSPTK